MIRLEGVSKTYHSRFAPPRTVLDDVSIEFPTGQNVGVLGLKGAGKSTLIRLLSGAEEPDSGMIVRDGLPSFPLGFANIFHPDLSGRDNVDFVSRVYGLERIRVREFTREFAELGPYFENPVKTYSTGMLAKLAFGLCLCGDFDVYLIDEITEVGDSTFREKALAAFRERMAEADIILVSHNADTLRQYCDMGALLQNGRLEMFQTVELALTAYEKASAVRKSEVP